MRIPRAETRESASRAWMFALGGALVVLVGGGLLMGSSHEDAVPPVTRSAPRVIAAATEAPVPEAPTLPPRREEARSLALVEHERLRDASLDDADRFENAGRFQEALDALADAEASGAKSLESRRVRLQALAARAAKVDEAFAECDDAEKTGEAERGLVALRRVEEAARELGRGDALDERRSRLDAIRERQEKLARGVAAIQRATERLEAGDLAAARPLVEEARGCVPGSTDLGRVERHLQALEHLPASMIYVAERDLYLRKKPVTNAELKAWIDRTGRSGAAPWSEYPAARANDAVTGVFVDAARAFAAARGERLPSDEEWPALRKALRLDADVKPRAGVFVSGFYTVKKP